MKILKLFNYKLIFASIFVISIIFTNTKAFAESANAKKVSVQRIEGSSKAETAALLSKYQWNDTSEYVVIVSSEDFFGALCAVPLASKFNCPILFTEKDALNKETKEEINRIKAKNAYIIGDTIFQSTEQQLKEIVTNIYRISGKDKVDISNNIASVIGESNKIFVVNENDIPDALSIASIAGKNKAPIMLTNKEELSEGSIDYIKKNNVKESYIIGGQGIISDNVLNKVPSPYRIFGENRYETNVDIINHFSDELKLDNTFIVAGENFTNSIEGIAAASAAQRTSSPLVLMGTSVSTDTKDFLESNNFNINNVVVIGGESILPITNFKLLDNYTNVNARDYLDIVSYDGSNQGCHPKVLYFPNKWNGWKYWMVFTPYPNGNDKYENPSVLVSQTGHKWVTPKGLINPVVSGLNQNNCHLSDPHILFNEKTNAMELWYRATYFDVEDRIIRVTSKDGVNWSSSQDMIHFYGVRECFSPTVIFEDNKYKMWYVDQNLKCMYIQSGDGTHWSPPKEVGLNLTDSYVPWHIDVIKTDLGYEVLVSAFKLKEAVLNNRVLMWGTSTDGLSFNNLSTILIPAKNNDSWDNKQIYRSTFIKVNGVYKVFYSAMNKKNEWHIGLSQGKSMQDLHGVMYRKRK